MSIAAECGASATLEGVLGGRAPVDDSGGAGGAAAASYDRFSSPFFAGAAAGAGALTLKPSAT
jgi:hypothetical protein